MRRFVCLLVAVTAACAAEPVVCDTSAAVSLSITVKDGEGAPIAGAAGAWTASVGAGACQSSSGVLQCGAEVGGELSVVVSAPGFVSKTVTATSEHGQCHAIGQHLDVVLDAVPKTTFDEDRRYVHAFFDSQAACDAAQPPGFFVNCCAFVSFRADGNAEMMLSDIMNAGTYVLAENRLTFTRVSPGDAPETMTFSTAADGLLTDDAQRWTWTRSTSGRCF